ncbi:MAG: hypothetical protein KIT25_01660 [Enhydrobacter sp.]|nr:MAG: hypothetical protein KIT25_01660 [Enhydrobacter sp.]
MTIQGRCRALLVLAIAALLPPAAHGQLSGPPAGGPTGQFLGPPSGNANDFLGVWDLSWNGPPEFNCPCRGTLTVHVDVDDNFIGYWKGPGPQSMLKGAVSYNQDVWTGRFQQMDQDVDFPLKGFFRLEARDRGRELTGSYHPDGTAIPFQWSATRRQ